MKIKDAWTHEDLDIYLMPRSLKIKMAEYDHILFMAPKCQTLFYTDLAKTKLLFERGISLEKVLENLPTFYDRLVATEWKIFAPGPC